MALALAAGARFAHQYNIFASIRVSIIFPSQIVYGVRVMAAAINLAQGKVVSLTGKVIAIAADGSQRILKLGDIVVSGERIIVPADGILELEAGNGQVLKIAEARDLTITDDVFGTAAIDA